MAIARLTDEQIARVKTWTEEGADLNQIQDRLKNEWDIRLTFMEARFLLSDLGLTLRPAADEDDDEETKAAVEAAFAEPDGLGLEPEDDLADDVAEAAGPAPAGGTVALTVDEITIPGALASGKVTFSDGRKASWSLDQMGRLGLSGVDRSYQPPEADLVAFQRELQKALRRVGY